MLELGRLKCFASSLQKTDSQENIIIPSDLLGETGNKSGCSSSAIYSDSIFPFKRLLKGFPMVCGFFVLFLFFCICNLDVSKSIMLWCLPPQVCTVSYFVYMSEVIRTQWHIFQHRGTWYAPARAGQSLLILSQAVPYSVQAGPCTCICCGEVASS